MCIRDRLPALYQIFVMNYEKNPEAAERAKQKILSDFPYTSYAEFVKNPKNTSFSKSSAEVEKAYSEAFDSVSYTHLDVYKRQDKRLPLAKIYQGLAYSKMEDYNRAEEVFADLKNDDLKKDYKKLLSVYLSLIHI